MCSTCWQNIKINRILFLKNICINFFLARNILKTFYFYNHRINLTFLWKLIRDQNVNLYFRNMSWKALEFFLADI